MRTKLVMMALIVALLVSAGAAALEAVASDELDGFDRLDGSDGLILWKQECPAHLGKIEVVDMGTSLLVMCLAVD